MESISCHRQLAVAAAFVLAACAETTRVRDAAEHAVTNTTPQLSVGGAMTDRGHSGANWIDSNLSVTGPFDWVTYEAGYAIQGGDVLPRLADASTLAPLTGGPARIGGDAFSQSLNTRLPSLAGASPQLSFQSVTGASRTIGGQMLSNDRANAMLAWNPAPVDLQLQWSAPRAVADPTQPLDCSLGGNLQFGLGNFGDGRQSLQLGARECSVDTAYALAAGLGVQSVSSAWQFGDPTMSHRLSLTRLSTAADPMQTGITEPPSTGYELQLAQKRSAGAWTGDTALGLRRVADFNGRDLSGRQWTAAATLRRQVADLALTAGWQRDADPLWFLPYAASSTDQLTVGIDMRRWMIQRLGLPNVVDATLTYRHNRSVDPTLDGGAVYWNLATSW